MEFEKSIIFFILENNRYQQLLQIESTFFQSENYIQILIIALGENRATYRRLKTVLPIRFILIRIRILNLFTVKKIIKFL